MPLRASLPTALGVCGMLGGLFLFAFLPEQNRRRGNDVGRRFLGGLPREATRSRHTGHGHGHVGACIENWKTWVAFVCVDEGACGTPGGCRDVVGFSRFFSRLLSRLSFRGLADNFTSIRARDVNSLWVCPFLSCPVPPQRPTHPHGTPVSPLPRGRHAQRLRPSWRCFSPSRPGLPPRTAFRTSHSRPRPPTQPQGTPFCRSATPRTTPTHAPMASKVLERTTSWNSNKGTSSVSCVLVPSLPPPPG